jgi:hypothetical protein
MSVLYCSVSRGDYILADAPSASRGLYREKVRGVLRLGYVFEKERRTVKFPRSLDNNAGELLMHFRRVDDVIFLCLAHTSCRLRIAHSFLEEVQSQFLASLGPTASLLRGGESFNDTLSRIYEYYIDPTNDRTVAARQQLENVQSLAIETVAELLERGDKVTALVERATELDNSSQHFRRTAQRTMVKERCANWRLQCAVAIVVAVIVLGVLLAITFFALWRTHTLDDVLTWITQNL